jgi:hypothetical protein
LTDAKEEVAFLRRVGIEEDGGEAGWTKGVKPWFDEMDATFQREERRQNMVFDERTVKKVMEVRRRGKEWALKRQNEKGEETRARRRGENAASQAVDDDKS